MFRSVKNWLTLLIVALVALAMLVAWVYVVPPLRGRLVQQKLADASASAQQISDTLAQFLSYDASTGLPTISDRDSLFRTLSIISSRFSGRAMVFTRNQVLLADSSGQTSPDVADYPMLDEAIRTRQVAQGTVTTANGSVAATAVPLFPQDGSRPWSLQCW